MAGQYTWCLIHTKPKQEKIAAEHLLRQNYCVYLPMLCRHKGGQGGPQASPPTPLFPRYLFIRLSAGVDDWGPIRSTKGVSDFVRFGVTPARVPDSLIAEIKAREGDNGLHHEVLPELVNGDKIRIQDGPFSGCSAIFKAHRGRDRVLILLDVIGKANLVEVTVDSVARYDR